MKINKYSYHKFLILSLLSGLLLLISSMAHAIAIYEGWGGASLTITDFTDEFGISISKPFDLIVEGDAYVFDEGALTIGNAAASKGGDATVSGLDPFDLNVGDGLNQEARASGSAAASFAESFFLTDGSVYLENTSFTDTFIIKFLLGFDYDVAASVGDPLIADAIVDVTILLEDDFGTLVDGFFSADALFGPSSDMGSDLFAFDLELLPGDYNSLYLRVDADGFAERVSAPVSVPEPTSLFLLGIGLVGLTVVSRFTSKVRGAVFRE